jgi:hypothetical protein
MSRWDHLYDLQPRAAVEVLLDEAAKTFVDDLRRWPPPLEGHGADVAALLEGPRPHESVYRQAFALVRLDLLHEYEALDRWQTEARWKDAQLTERERDQALFFFRYVGEQVYSLSEALRTSLPRRQLVALVDRIERRLLALGAGVV